MKEGNDRLTRILDTAAELFATQPFHKVLMDDVAAQAAVGKGTLYLYFKSKDDLYFGVLLRGFDALVKQIQEYTDNVHLPADEQLGGMIDIMVVHLSGKAFNMGLVSGVMTCPTTETWREMRLTLWKLVEDVIRRGIKEGLFEDAAPFLTGRYITGLVRSACLFNPDNVDTDTISAHIRQFVLKGLSAK